MTKLPVPRVEIRKIDGTTRFYGQVIRRNESRHARFDYITKQSNIRFSRFIYPSLPIFYQGKEVKSDE